MLIDAGADIDTQNSNGFSPLRAACVSEELEVVKTFVRAGVGVGATNDGGDTCLITAACNGLTKTVRYLLCLPEVDVNHRGADNHTALHCAVLKKYTDVVQVLIDAGADVVSFHFHVACGSMWHVVVFQPNTK